MDKQSVGVAVYYDNKITERAKNYLNNASKDDIEYLTKKFREIIISREMRNYRFLYNAHLIICSMYKEKNIIKVKVNDIYHI